MLISEVCGGGHASRDQWSKVLLGSKANDWGNASCNHCVLYQRITPSILLACGSSKHKN
jgi:hypothetical protein